MASEATWNIAAQLKEDAAKALGEVLSERALLRPEERDEERALRTLNEIVEKANRSRAFATSVSLSDSDRRQVAQHLHDLIFRLGPLQRFLDDPEVEELIVNGHGRAFVIRARGRKEPVETMISDDEELRSLMVRAATRFGRRLDEASPAVDVQLPSGRLHAVIPPLVRYPCLTVRRRRLAANDLPELVALGTLCQESSAFLTSAVRSGFNILVSGGTATGKTTLLHALGREIPEWERVVTIEETAELELDSALADCVALEARFANIEGIGAVSIRSLVRNALRMRPSRIVVGEVRGPEALDMLSAMNSGHDGSMCTLHANSTRQALSKLRTYVVMGEESLGAEVVNEMIGETIDLIVQLRLNHAIGRRVVQTISEVAGVEQSRVLTNELFRREREQLSWTGLRPRCADRMEERGHSFGWPAMRVVEP